MAEIRPAESIGDTDQHRADNSPAHGPQAAEDDDHECTDEDFVADTGIDGEDRRRGDSREPRERGAERGAEREDNGKQQLEIDSQRPGNGRIAGAGPDHHSEAGMADEKIKCKSDNQAKPDDDQPVDGIGRARNDLHHTHEPWRNRRAERLRPPDPSGAFVENQDHAERAQDLIEVVELVQSPDQQEFEDEAQQEATGHREHDRESV